MGVCVCVCVCVAEIILRITLHLRVEYYLHSLRWYSEQLKVIALIRECSLGGNYLGCNTSLSCK